MHNTHYGCSYRFGHTDLWNIFVNCLHKASGFESGELPNAMQEAISRRQILLGTIPVGSRSGDKKIKPQNRRGPRIAIVGAGLAGLNAAHQLRKNGFTASVYDAASRIGGRILSERSTFSSGNVVELGGEFIDSSHWDMLTLASEFQLPLLDMNSVSEEQLLPSYYFEGQHHSESQIIEALGSIMPRIAEDAKRLSKIIDHRHHTPLDRQFDMLPLASYFDELGVSGWIRKFLDVAYVTEYGLNTEEQSSLNFLSMIETETSSGLRLFGASDQRFKIAGGNQLLVEHLADGLVNDIKMEHRLVQIRRSRGRSRLVFDSKGKTVVVDADIVVLALPFSLLRQVEVGDALPIAKWDAIRKLGYGTNAKLLIGITEKVWRSQGLSGDLYTNNRFQTGWDSSRLREAKGGEFTFFLGGSIGRTLNSEDVVAQSNAAVQALELIFPGTASAYTGFSRRIHWPSEQYSLGSYSSFRPGQWTTIAGIENYRVGNFYFAGEHCSTKFQGFMNGAAETGRVAAEAIIRRLI